MISLSYDLHIHSCLSPCGDDEMTPGNIVGMATLKQLDVIALTDHNSCKNCPPFMQIAEEYGITAIPGMELCTVEEVHVICLFPTLNNAMCFDNYVFPRIISIPNNEYIFGKQQICNKNDAIIGSEHTLLINATNIPFHEVSVLVKKYHGIMFPAHIDKKTNSLLSNLGFIPPESQISCVEVAQMKNLKSLKETNPYLEMCNIITNSDAHYLNQINEPVNKIISQSNDIRDILRSLISK